MESGNNALTVVQAETAPAVFDTREPGLVITKATGIANQLSPIVERAKLYSVISGRKYVKVEGWTTMLAMLGVFPHVEYCRRVEGDVLGYQSRVILKTMDGREVGAGEALCSSAERNWSNRDEFALKSMAQTRATGKAARNGFSWIMALAGYEATPAEEMNGDEHSTKAAPKPSAEGSIDGKMAGREVVEGRFSAPEEFTSKKGKAYHVVMDNEGSRYFVFDKGVVEFLAKNVENQVRVEIESTPKGTRIVGVIDESA